MTATAETSAVRAVQGGHVVRLHDGREVEFGTVWIGCDGDQLKEVVVWTHDLSDVETLLRARTYLEGPFERDNMDPYELAGGVGVQWAREFWPDVEGDLSQRLRRVWARWHVVTDEEYDNGLEGDFEPGRQKWVESAEPGEGLRPAVVIELKR